jgi:ATP-GRASP peptide maturase of grasp-with-spasm system
MILILSKSQNELSTEEVIDWLYHFKVDFFRLNGDDLENEPFSMECNQKALLFEGILEKFSQSNVIWHRRWYETENIHYFQNLAPSIASRYNSHIRNEIRILSNFIFERFRDKRWVDNVFDTRLNKLLIIEYAKSEGLDIPNTLVANTKRDVMTFMKKNGNLITKPICEVLFLNYKQISFLTHTKVVDEHNIDVLPDQFFPSLFQKNIKKEYEVRTVIIGEDVYSMAIFSQTDTQTQVDFRNYNKIMPNRFVPYQLPKCVQNKILSLMKKLNLQTGSLDLIKSADDGKYYFLEINPMGQFSMVSKPCNYFLEKKMAQYLINSKKK